MINKGVVLLIGFAVILSGWWVISSGSLAQSEEGAIDVWATWGDDPAQLQALLDRYGQSSDVPVRVTTRVRSDNLLQGLVEALDGWIQASSIDLDDIYLAPLAQCHGLDGATFNQFIPQQAIGNEYKFPRPLCFLHSPNRPSP